MTDEPRRHDPQQRSFRSIAKAIPSSPPSAAATLLLGLFSTTLFWIGLILTAWCAYFFRDPERVTPIDDRLVVSPADGVVSAVGPAVPPRELGLGNRRDDPHLGVHERVLLPCEPRAGARPHRQDRASRRANSSTPNSTRRAARTSATAWSSTAPTARSPSCRSPAWWRAASSAGPRPARNIGIGERFGLIRFGSRVDVFLPHGGDAARRGRPDGGRRRDRARRIRRRGRRRRSCGFRSVMDVPPFEPHGSGGPRIREIPLRMVLPNLITVLAICAGLSGIRLAFEDRFETAVVMVLVAAFLDGIDGRVARLLKAHVEIRRADGFAGRHRQFRRRAGAGALCLPARPRRLAGLDRGAAVRHRLRPAARALQRARRGHSNARPGRPNISSACRRRPAPCWCCCRSISASSACRAEPRRWPSSPAASPSWSPSCWSAGCRSIPARPCGSVSAATGCCR